MEDLHISARIEERAKEIRIGATELGKLIGTSKQNIYGIFKRKTINTGQQQKLSIVLDFDFFALYTNSDLGLDT